MKYDTTMAALSVSCNQNFGTSPLLPTIKCGLQIPCILVALLSPLQLLPFPVLTSRKEQTDGQSDCIHNEVTVAIQAEFRTVFPCDVLLLSVQFSLNYSYVADYKRRNIVEHVIRLLSLPSLEFLFLYNVC
jgi:hypothetical protein